MVSGAIQLIGPGLYQFSGTPQVRPFQKEGQTGFKPRGLHRNRFGLILGLDIVEIWQLFEMLFEPGDIECFTKTGPAVVLSLIEPSQCKQAIDIGCIPRLMQVFLNIEICGGKQIQRRVGIPLA